MPPTPRLAPLDPPHEPELAAELAAMMPPGVPPLRLFRTLAHNRRVLGKIRAGNLLDRGAIERREREIVILRTTARCGAEYEWGVHVAFFAAKVGLSEAQLRATARGGPDDPAWSPRDGLLVRLADELHDTSRLSDTLWKTLAAHWTPAQLVELVAVAGFYHLISFALNAFSVEHEEGAPRFPA